MRTNTRIYDRKQKRIRDQAQENRARIERALKAARLPFTAGPEQQIRALESYIQALRDLEEELTADYGIDELRDSFWHVRIELTQAVEQITNLKIEQIKPEAL